MDRSSLRWILRSAIEGKGLRGVFLALVGLALVGCGAATPATSPSSAVSPATSRSATATTSTAPSMIAPTEPATKSAKPAYSLDPFYSGFETIGFGLGGSGCTIAKLMTTFATDDPIRVNAEYTPSLPAGTVVTIDLSRDGFDVPGYPHSLTFKTATKCIYGNISPGTLPTGHYRMDVAPDSAPAISGEFDTK
jgi:hypothetical protein